MRIIRIQSRPLHIPLTEPFIIATARMDETLATQVEVIVEDERTHQRVVGIGEAAPLPPVTQGTPSSVAGALRRMAHSFEGQFLDGHSAIEALLDEELGDEPVARAGLEMALLDAWGKLESLPVHALLGGEPLPRGRTTFSWTTDITIPIAPPAHMAMLALGWRGRGFQAFKVKVGKNVDDDARAIAAIAAAVPDAELRLDGNAALVAKEAMSLVAATRSAGVQLACFEQPCAADDLDGMAFVTELAGCPVVADESVRDMRDLSHVVAARAATGVNIKVQKHGGLVQAARIARAARRAGLKVMAGAMVESRLGISAMAHVVRSLGGVDFADLDTALLLKSDPFVGGYVTDGARMTLVDDVGLGVSPVRAQA